MWSNRNSCSPLMGMHSATATVEDALVVSYKANLFTHFSSHVPQDLPNWLENICSHHNLHTNIYSSFNHNHQKLKANKMSFNRWMDQYCGAVIQWMEYRIWHSNLNLLQIRETTSLKAKEDIILTRNFENECVLLD